MHGSGAEGMFMSGTISLVQNGNPVAGADIIAFDQTRTTDENGVAQFEHVVSGTSQARIIYQGKEYAQELHVSTPHTSVSLTGESEVYIPSNESNPAFGHASISQKAATDKENSYGLGVLVAGVIVAVAGWLFYQSRITTNLALQQQPEQLSLLQITHLILWCCP